VPSPDYDVFIAGGGINGCGIARDLAGRGLKTGLAEMGDLAQGTSSASTKLIHGGLRYLEQYEFGLVREALKEREVLLSIAPHIVRPLRFVLPHTPGMRPRWMLRLGLLLYDHLARRVSLPASHALDLRTSPAGGPLEDTYSSAFEYSDCRVDDARLVIANARDAALRGADIFTRTKLTGASRNGGIWKIGLSGTGGQSRQVTAAMLINATGPWADNTAKNIGGASCNRRIRLVQGAHIVTARLFDHDKAYMFQNRDGRIVFAIPYENSFTLVGTTDTDFSADPLQASAGQAEIDYLIAAVNSYFRQQISSRHVVWSFAGVRALADSSKGKAQKASREYLLDVEADGKTAPLLSVLGGKITSYRTLAEHVVSEMIELFPGDARLRQKSWTAACPLPGGETSPSELERIAGEITAHHDWLQPAGLARWLNTYGGEARQISKFCLEAGTPGIHFGHGLYEIEVRWLMQNEWAQTADDILWRRTKLGLHFKPDEVTALDRWMSKTELRGSPP
jgi:glycerol-3-phosphate dehydrogenase